MPAFDDSFEELNTSQQKAVRHREGHLLIVAGPGTGKTHTLVYRIASLLKELKKGEKILAITFTQKAARQMRDRLVPFLKDDNPPLFVGTFHQFCLNLLKEHSPQACSPIIDPAGSEAVAKELWPELSLRERRLLLEKISQWKVGSFDEEALPEAEILSQRYKEKSFMDFDDILLQALRLLRKRKDVLKDVQAAYSHVCVDEYQDINQLQHEILKVLVGEGGALTAIGDPHQAIYGFRGSDVRFFGSFEKDFPGARVLLLSENYRSAQHLLKASGQVAQSIAGRFVPDLTAKIYLEGKLTVHEAPTDKAEAEYIVHQVEKLVGGTSLFSQIRGAWTAMRRPREVLGTSRSSIGSIASAVFSRRPLRAAAFLFRRPDTGPPGKERTLSTTFISHRTRSLM